MIRILLGLVGYPDILTDFTSISTSFFLGVSPRILMECYVCVFGYTISATFVIVLSLVDDANIPQVGQLGFAESCSCVLNFAYCCLVYSLVILMLFFFCLLN